MWLRDSMNQLMPFVPYVLNDTKIDWLIKNVIIKQASLIRIDPYANAFNENVMQSDHYQDSSQRLVFGNVPYNAIFKQSIVFERKYEIDSLAAFLRLSN
jgi:meiotically up-regulated gene 157 (Mug157) protein